FSFTAPDPWIFGAPNDATQGHGGPGTAVAEGFYLFLHPLSKGSHTLHFGGAFDSGGIDMTYHITVGKIPMVVPPGKRYAGKSYAEWSAEWSKWALSLPTDHHPLFDTADCGTAQSGKVWFLGGTFTGNPATRSCTIPEGKALLFPIL